MAILTVIMKRTDEDESFEGSLESFHVEINIGDPDQLDGWLNAFSQIQRAAGFSYEGVGVHSKLINGEDVEHWSDY